MDTGLLNKNFFLRDLIFNDQDLLFTYNLLIKRLSKKNTIVDFITNTEIPSYESHISNLKNKFKHLKILMINDIHVGFIPVDKNNFFGMFYDYSQLKKAFKKYNLKSNNFDQTTHYLQLLKATIKKGESLFAYINPENTLSNRGCRKVFKHIANLYGFKNE